MKDYSYFTDEELLNNVELQDDPLAKMLLDRLLAALVKIDKFIEEKELVYDQLADQLDALSARRHAFNDLQMKYDDLSAYILKGLDND